MPKKERLTPKALGYEELLVVVRRPKRKTKPLSRLYSVVREIEEADPGFHVKMEIMVPHPSFENPKPCVFVLLQRATQRIWFRLKSWKDVQALFGLNEQDLAGLEQALAEAERIAEALKEARAFFICREAEIYAEMQKAKKR